ncbi:MAG: YchF/TatD family DNA exonuclease [Candidatus Edwardsbacteria bacterium]|nr:YchF/TatD family DNA exonuclease [Candidatus Edwardsbacteria bacterium]
MTAPTMTHRLIDTHAHLTMKDFASDRAEVIARALDAGVKFIINAGYDLPSSAAGVELTEKYDCCYAAVGVHPHDARQLDRAALCELEELSKNPKVVALGEMGLDYYRNRSPRQAQIEAFKSQIEIAKRRSLPLIVHDRDAHADTMDILKASGAKNVVLHCFPGDAAMAAEARQRGYLISAGGPVTFKNSRNLPEALKAASLESLMLETDCPYLAPEPHRGKRNEPLYLNLIANRIAEILSPLTFGDVCRVTTHNAERFFGIGEIPAAAIAYRIRDSLYLNVTNRCTNACAFCIRQKTDFIKGHNLKLEREPDADEVIAAIGDPSKYHEVVFCGYGEPLLRLDLVKQAARWLKENKARVRLNTNGQGNLIAGRNIVPELVGLIDEVSVSLNAADDKTYQNVCHSRYGDLAFAEVKYFVSECKRAGIATSVTALDMPGVSVAACGDLARELGVPLRVRHYDAVG